MSAKRKDLREKGRRLLSEGCVTGDTSGRTRQMGEKSVFGLASKNFGFSVSMSSLEKKKVFRKLKKQYNDKRAKTIIHSVKIFYAIKDYIDIYPSFYICCDGFSEGLLKHYLKLFLNFKYHDKKINFLPSLKSLFGKKHPGHILAWNVKKGKMKPTLGLKEKHFKKLNLF